MSNDEPPEPKIFVSEPISLNVDIERITRADLEFYGLDHSSASFEGRIFLNNPQVGHDTEPTSENGYAGSIFIFGHGSCYGDAGHCEIRASQGIYDLRKGHKLTPAYKFVTITEKLKEIAKNSKQIIVTVVPIITGYDEKCKDVENILKFEKLSLITYDR